MIADDVEELHEFANKIGMDREWFQNKDIPHYDLTGRMRKRALIAGAKEIVPRNL